MTNVSLPASYVRVAKDIYYPFNYVLPSGDLFTFCDTVGLVMNPYSGAVRAYAPPIPSSAGGVRTQYPYTATSVMLPLSSSSNYTVEVMIFGGQFTSALVSTTAADVSLRIAVQQVGAGTVGAAGTAGGTNGTGGTVYKFGSWVVEKMPYGRVMPDAVLLPNGRVIILNGAKVRALA